MIELTHLYSRRPNLHALDEEVAAWYLAKGRLHEELSKQGGPDAAQEIAYAAQSYEHARILTRKGRSTADRSDVASA